MSLGRFLAAGRSLMGMSEADGRYQMRSKNRLPKFGSEKNPFSHTTKPEQVTVRAEAKVELAPIQQIGFFEPMTEDKESMKLEETKSLRDESEIIPAPASAQNIELGATPVAPTVLVTRKNGSIQMKDFFKKINPLSRLAALKGEKGASPRPARTHVQTELSLEKVKPVRNDLSDSDLEVVTPKRVVLHKGPQPYLKPLTKPEPTTWNRLTSRLFGHTEVR